MSKQTVWHEFGNLRMGIQPATLFKDGLLTLEAHCQEYMASEGPRLPRIHPVAESWNAKIEIVIPKGRANCNLHKAAEMISHQYVHDRSGGLRCAFYINAGEKPHDYSFVIWDYNWGDKSRNMDVPLTAEQYSEINKLIDK